MDEAKNILVVDDEEVMRTLLSDVLTDAGYKVDAVSSAEEAIIKNQENKYSIVITDLKMPGASGVEVLKKVKSVDSDICVVVVTAYPSIESVIEVMREGAYDYIMKPFNIDEIKLIINRASERQHLIYEAKQKEYYRELSILDGLTGVYNRRYLDEVLPREVERARRYNHPLCLFMIDLDDFKKYNDAKGHIEGDKLLKDFAKFVVSGMRAGDIIFRYGGEEFLIINTETSKQNSIVVARRLINLTNKSLPVTISIGISCFPEDASNQEDLIKKADEALYNAKKSGKNRFCLFEQDKKQEA